MFCYWIPYISTVWVKENTYIHYNQLPHTCMFETRIKIVRYWLSTYVYVYYKNVVKDHAYSTAYLCTLLAALRFQFHTPTNISYFFTTKQYERAWDDNNKVLLLKVWLPILFRSIQWCWCCMLSGHGESFVSDPNECIGNNGNHPPTCWFSATLSTESSAPPSPWLCSKPTHRCHTIMMRFRPKTSEAWKFFLNINIIMYYLRYFSQKKFYYCVHCIYLFIYCTRF